MTLLDSNRHKQRVFRAWASFVGRGAGLLREATPPLSGSPTLIVPPSSPGSLGDEAMMAACVARLRAEGASRIGVVAFGDERTWPGIAHDLEVIPLADYFTTGFARGALRYAKNLARYRRVWVLGADVLDGHYSVAGSVRRIHLARIAAEAGLDASILGFSFRADPHPHTVDAMRSLPPEVRICARDPASYRRLVVALGRPIDLVADAAFLLPADPTSPVAAAAAAWIDQERQAGRVVLGVNVSYQPFRSETSVSPDRVVEIYVQALRSLLAGDLALSVLLIPHDYRYDKADANDAALTARVYDALSDCARVRASGERLTAGAAKYLASRLDAVIVGRMHLAIAALGSGVPVGGIAYQGKFAGLYEHFGVAPLTVAPSELSSAAPLEVFMRSVLAQRDELRPIIANKLPAVQRRAASNFDGRATSGSRRALVITPEPSHPPTKGNRARILEISERFEQLGYEVHIAQIETFPSFQDARPAMLARWSDRYYPIPYRSPLSTLRKLRRRTRAWLSNDASFDTDDWYCVQSERYLRQLAAMRFDVVIVNYVWQSRALELFDPSTLKVLDTHDVFTDRFARVAAAGKRPHGFSTTRAGEARGISRAHVVLAIQDLERTFLASLGTPAEVATIGHRVPIVHQQRRDDSMDIVLVGSGNQANIAGLQWFVDDVLPLVKARIPSARLVIAGALAGHVTDRDIDERLGVVDDLSSVYARASVVVVPVMFGTGLKIKTIEALGFGAAVVTTPHGAEGLELGAQTAFRVAPTAPSMAEAIIELLSDPAQRRQLGDAAHAFTAQWNRHSEDEFERLFAPTERRAP